MQRTGNAMRLSGSVYGTTPSEVHARVRAEIDRLTDDRWVSVDEPDIRLRKVMPTYCTGVVTLEGDYSIELVQVVW